MEDLIEDKNHVYSKQSKAVQTFATLLKTNITDKGWSDDVTYSRTHTDERTDRTRAKVGTLASTVVTSIISKDATLASQVLDRRIFTEMLVNDVCGYGAIQPLYQSDKVNEIQVNGPSNTFIEWDGRTSVRVAGCQYSNKDHLNEMIQSIAASVGRTFEFKHPILDAMLADLSRIHADHVAVSVLGPNLDIRKHKTENLTIRDLIRFGSITEDMARDVAMFFKTGMSVLVSGVTGSGKAIPLTTQIPTRNGFILAQDVKESTPLFDMFGETTYVRGVYPQGKLDEYAVTMRNGEREHTEYCSIDHLWVLIDGRVVTTGQLRVNQLLPALNGTIAVGGTKVHGTGHNQVVSVTPTGRRVDMVCFKVDSPTETFLMGPHCTPTHNTTLLSNTLALIPPNRRIITIENTLELELRHPNLVVFRTRETEAAPITSEDMIKACLRLMPDNIVVGEVRSGDEIRALLDAASSGHTATSSIHAGSADETAKRCQQLMTATGELSDKAALESFAAGINIVIVQQRFNEDNSRKITQIVEVLSDLGEKNGLPVVRFNPLWEYVPESLDENGKLVGSFVKRGEITPELRQKFRAFGERPTLEEIYQLTESHLPTSYQKYKEEEGSWNVQ